MCTSSFHGKIAEIPGISVDNFERVETEPRAYFLSHCHTDHTKGLFSRALIESLAGKSTFIYMSEVTASVIKDESNNSTIMKYVKPLKLGTNTVTLPSVPKKNQPELLLYVTLVPAAHSFGSVMFIFRTNGKTILFTGDFRIRPNDVSKFTHFHKIPNDSSVSKKAKRNKKDIAHEPIDIDVMYVDTTFQNNEYECFPKRSDSTEYALGEIKDYLEEDDGNRVALHTSARFGYEYVFNEIYDKLGMKVYVNDQRWKFYSTVPHLVQGVTNDENETRIHLCLNRSEISDHYKCLTNTKTEHKYLFVYFSAMKWRGYQMEDSSTNRVSEGRLDVCFPTHCSRHELVYFVNYFSPKKVVGFPDEYVEFENDGGTSDFVVTPLKRKVTPQKSFVDRKEDKKVLRQIFG